MLNNEVWETLLEYDAILMPWRSASRRAHSRLHRRKRTEPTAAPLPDLGATRTDAGAAISLQLIDAVSNGGRDLVDFYFRLNRGTSDRFPWPPAVPSARQAAYRLGWPAESPQPNGLRFRAPAVRAGGVGVFADLRSGTEPGRVSVGALETR